MARFARIVVPGLPHHVTQRGNRREPIFFESGDHDVYCDMLAEQTHRHGVEVSSPLPDAQPRPPYPDPLDRRGPRPCHGRGASTHHQLRQRAGALERPPVPGTLCLGCDGRGPPDRGGPHHQPQSCPRPPGLPRGRLAWSSVRAHLSGEDDGLVRAPGTRSGRTVWPTHRRWGGGGATLRRGAARVEIVGDHRPSIGSNRLRGRSRTAPRQTACAARAGAKASNRARETSELILREVECRGMGHT